MNKDRVTTEIRAFISKLKNNAADYEALWRERNERKSYYQSFNKSKIISMDLDEFYIYIGKLWSMLIWGNKKYVVDKLIEDNGFEKLKSCLAELMFGINPIADRWDKFLGEIKGLGPASVSELLTYSNPEEYVIFNKTTILCFTYLEVSHMPKYNYQYTGKKYAEICTIAREIALLMRDNGFIGADLLAVDYFLWDEILPKAEKKVPVLIEEVPDLTKISKTEAQSFHDEIKGKLVEIGKLLGFDSRSEVKIASGAIVDAVWEVQIGNMGKVQYVFEVQSKGSIDSLILNLRKAQSYPSVQAVIAVADEAQLEKIKRESTDVINEKTFRVWDSGNVLIVYDSLVRAHESINKLELMPKSL